MPIRRGAGEMTGLYLGAVQITRAYLGDVQCWPAETPGGGWIDPAHQLANRAVLARLGGALQGMTGDARTTFVGGALASTTAGTDTFAREALPAVPATCRVSAIVRVSKTSGRRAWVGLASVAAATESSASAEIGHTAGTGIQIRSQGFTFVGPTLVQEASLVDGREYRVTLTYDNAVVKGTTQNGRILGTVEELDGTVVGFATSVSDVRWAPASYVPRALTARTNHGAGAIRDLVYVDSLLGIAPDEGFVRINPHMGAGTDQTDRAWIQARPLAAPLRVVITAGGSGTYGGAQDWGSTMGRNTEPWPSFRRTWEALADAGYTVLHPNALHEGWGANDHLTKQLEALAALEAQFGTAEVFYLGYSMGGLSAWRAVRGRAAFPAVEAAYIVAGAVDLSAYSRTSYPQLATRWPDPGLYDSPKDYAGADLIARGTRVRSVTSSADLNVPKASTHDVMKGKYGASPLFSERVVTGGHFDAALWDPADVVAFFNG